MRKLAGSLAPHMLFWVAILAVISVAWALYDSEMKTQAAAGSVARTHETLEIIRDVDDHISQAENAQREYLVASSERSRTARQLEVAAAMDALLRLEGLVADDHVQTKRLGGARQRITTLDMAMKVVAERHALNPMNDAAAFATAKLAAAKVYDLMNEMSQHEQGMLRAQQEEQRRRYDFSMILLAASGALVLMVLLPAYVAFIRQIRARARAERSLVEVAETADLANRAKSTFLAVMSHEIRTPMNGVLGMLEILSLTRLDPEQRATVNVVRESGKSLQRIIDDILDFSKIEAGKLEIALVPSSLREVLEGARNIYLGCASSKGLLLQCNIDPEISPALQFDPLRMRQIVNNLVSNAIKFTMKGHVSISAVLIDRTHGVDTVRITVRDTGQGISDAGQQRLFQPFAQANSETARAFGGTGLGLTICKRLTEMMGGTIEVSSALEQGTCVSVVMPLEAGDLADLPVHAAANLRNDQMFSTCRTAPSIAEAEREGTLVLIADDHPTNRMMMSRQVHILGYAAETAENGLDALRKWESGRFSLLLTDCNMPQLDGYGLARRVREAEAARKCGRIPIIACTANALRGEAEICLSAGMDDYLPKPMQLPELAEKLGQWLPLPGAAASPAEAHPPVRLHVVDRHRLDDVLDRSMLAAVSGGVLSSEHALLLEYRLANDEDAVSLQEAAHRSDVRGITRVAHRMKGAARMVGALPLAAACERLEIGTRKDERADLSAWLKDIEHELERLNAYIDSLTSAAAAA